MTYNFAGKTAVVTGASRGLGEAIARTLAADGARVIMVARTADKLRAMAAQMGYATSKGAVNAFAGNASLDLGRFGVRVNAVAPGVIDDGMWKTAFASGVDRDKTMEAMARLLPLEKRWGSAQDIADAVAFL